MVRCTYNKEEKGATNMSTNNFENAKNGIFVIEEYEPLPYEEWLDDMGYEDNEDAKDEYNLIAEDEDRLGMAIADTMDNIIYELRDKGYEVIQTTPYDYKVVGEYENIGLRVQSGYYANAQIIITTQRDEQLINMDTSMTEEDITKVLYEFVDDYDDVEYTDDKSYFEDDDEYHLNKVLHNVLWYANDYEEVLDDMLDDDKVVIDVVSQYTTVLKKIGNFSNGEALYEKA